MKKILQKAFFGIAISLSSTLAIGQIDGNTNIAPNFDGFDINGNPHNFYEDYLDNNIPIILDVSAHWCSPCWSYHNTKVLEDLYNQYGPSGTIEPNKVMVLWADGDQNSTFAKLYGGAGSQGDWVTGSSFPIFGGDTGVGANHGRQIANLYKINYFPTVFMIHPDRTVEEVGTIGTVSSFISKINTANMLSGDTNDLNLKYGYPLPSVCPGASLTFDFIMKNQGNQPITSAQIDAEVEGEVIYSHNWVGNLAPYFLSEEKITFTLDGIDNGEKNLELIVKSVNGLDDQNSSNNKIVRPLNLKETEARYYTLSIKTDNAGNETNWFILNEDDQTVLRRDDFNGGPYGNNSLYEHQLDLKKAGCYKLLVTDSDGDGMTGYINLKDANNQNIGFFSVDGMESEISWESNVVLSVAQKEITSTMVYPNPFENELTIDLKGLNTSVLSYDIVNILGQPVLTGNNLSAKETFTIHTKTLEGGIYMLNLNVDGNIITKKIVK